MEASQATKTLSATDFFINKGIIADEEEACKTEENCFLFIAKKFPQWTEKKVQRHVHECDNCVCEDC